MSIQYPCVSCQFFPRTCTGGGVNYRHAFVWKVNTCLEQTYDDRTTDSMVQYQKASSVLECTLSDADSEKHIAFGKFNADHNRGRFCHYLSQFAVANELTSYELESKCESFTYLRVVFIVLVADWSMLCALAA